MSMHLALSTLGPPHTFASECSPIAGRALFSSPNCPDLAVPTFLQTHRTHLIFSLHSIATAVQQTVDSSGRAFGLITLRSRSPVS
jgi:hypothetical protein